MKNASRLFSNTREGEKHTLLERWFPTPRLLNVPKGGIDISDSSAKWLSLTQAERGFKVSSYGGVQLEPGVVEGGVVRDEKMLGAALKKLRDQVGSPKAAHAALPEEAAYVFGMHVDDVHNREQVLNIIEFELEGRVPLKADAAVYDYDVVRMHEDDIGAEIGVTVFPADAVEGYINAFKEAGIALLSLELEARSIARAVIGKEAKGVTLVADFGRERTGIAVIHNNVPIFTSTVSVGGTSMNRAIMEKIGVSEPEAEKFRNEHGISQGGNEKVVEAISGTASALADEITRHYQYWDGKRNEDGDRVTPIAQVLLCGGSSNLKGLPEYISERVHARAALANVWENICDFDDYIPPIDKKHSLGYATAIGLALRGA